MENEQAARIRKEKETRFGFVLEDKIQYPTDDAQGDAVTNKWDKQADLSTLEQIRQLDL